ncbi:MAG: hypothetical protein ACRCRP_01495 [Metamycoplasmataceae bacterium]
MHNNTQLPYFTNKISNSYNINFPIRRPINSNFGYNSNQQILTRTNNGWIIQGNTQAPEETQTLSLNIIDKYTIPLNNMNKQVHYNYIPQPQSVFVPNVNYNYIPQQHCFFSHTHYNCVPQQPPITNVQNPTLNNTNNNTNTNTNTNNTNNNSYPTSEKLLPLIHEAMDIIKAQKILLDKFIDINSHHEDKQE